MLTWINPKAFKSFGWPEEDADPIKMGPLTMLVGANASGKSNLLELIRVFQGLALGFPIIEVIQGVQRGGREVWPGLRGGVAELHNHGASDCHIEIGINTDGADWEYGIELSHKGGDLYQEWLMHRTRGRAVVMDLSNSPPAEFEVVDREYNKPSYGVLSEALSPPPGRSILLNPGTAVVEAIGVDGTPVRDFLARSQVLDLVPARMRDYSQRSVRQISSEGEHLSAILRYLVEDCGLKDDLLDWISELCAPKIRDLSFVHVRETGDIIFQLVEDSGVRVTAKAVSDGTLRFLGLIAALWTLPQGAMLCLEEIERGLHPSRIDLLVELLVQVVRDRQIQVIATTHSPRVLHALGRIDPDHLGRAVIFARPEHSSGTITRSLGDLPAFEDACKQRGIEHLFTAQWLEMAL